MDGGSEIGFLGETREFKCLRPGQEVVAEAAVTVGEVLRSLLVLPEQKQVLHNWLKHHSISNQLTGIMIDGHTREKTGLATRSNTSPPAIVNLFNLLEVFAFYQIHLIILRGLLQNLGHEECSEKKTAYLKLIKHERHNTSSTGSCLRFRLKLRFLLGDKMRK